MNMKQKTMAENQEERTLLKSPAIFKPMKYPWAYEAWLTQQKVHWLPEEVPLAEDVKDWHHNLTESERNLVTQIFRFFTQSDVEVEGAYTLYQTMFKPIEVLMMLSAFQNIETIHIAAYSHLLDTIGMPEAEYSAFLKYKEMKAKHDYLTSIKVESKYDLLRAMITFFMFAEGMALFASFVILLNFPRFNKMKGMGQIVTWSIRDETLHCLSGIMLIKTFMSENPDIDPVEVQKDTVKICREMIEHEDAFIDLAFALGPVEGLDASQVKQYIRFIANRRMIQAGMEAIYLDVLTNPLPWVDEMVNAVEHANFFENRATEYSRASTVGTWDDAFMRHINK